MNRHRNLVLRKGDQTANARMDSVNKEIMDTYFSMLKDTLTEYGLLNSPSQTYKVDKNSQAVKSPSSQDHNSKRTKKCEE